jgi:hypothetical protein
MDSDLLDALAINKTQSKISKTQQKHRQEFQRFRQLDF